MFGSILESHLIAYFHISDRTKIFSSFMCCYDRIFIGKPFRSLISKSSRKIALAKLNEVIARGKIESYLGTAVLSNLDGFSFTEKIIGN